jgi:hypothetical protein
MSSASEFPRAAVAVGCPTRTPAEVAAALGVRVIRDPGRARWGDRLLVSALEPSGHIRLYALGINELAAIRDLAPERVQSEALAHEVLHIVAPSLAEEQVGALAERWADVCDGRCPTGRSPNAVADL